MFVAESVLYFQEGRVAAIMEGGGRGEGGRSVLENDHSQFVQNSGIRGGLSHAKEKEEDRKNL